MRILKIIRYFYRKAKSELAHKKYDGKKAVLHYPPGHITVGITGYCAFQCKFCVSHSKDARGHHQNKVPYNMSFEDFKTITDMAYKAGVPHVHICGIGEPLLHKDFFKMYDYLTKYYPYSSLQTDFIKNHFEKNNIIEKILARKKTVRYLTTDLFPKDVHETIKIGSDYNYVLDSLEKLSKQGNIKIYVHQILTKQTYRGMAEAVEELHTRGIRFEYHVVHLHPAGFNNFTDIKNIYTSEDSEITRELEKLKLTADRLGIKTKIPLPYDKVREKSKGKCLLPWSRVQIMPTKKVPSDKWPGNAIVGQCTAVVKGDFYTLGNVLDYDKFMDFWNNPFLVKIRKDMMNGTYPDAACKNCYKYSKKTEKI